MTEFKFREFLLIDLVFFLGGDLGKRSWNCKMLDVQRFT